MGGEETSKEEVGSGPGKAQQVWSRAKVWRVEGRE